MTTDMSEDQMERALEFAKSIAAASGAGNQSDLANLGRCYLASRAEVERCKINELQWKSTWEGVQKELTAERERAEKAEAEAMRWEGIATKVSMDRDQHCVRADKAEAERDKLFLEVGKYADVPSFEYWKERAIKAESGAAAMRWALEQAREELSTSGVPDCIRKALSPSLGENIMRVVEAAREYSQVACECKDCWIYTFRVCLADLDGGK